MVDKSKIGIKHLLVIFWILFTVALTIWLFAFTRSLFVQILESHVGTQSEIYRQMRMILMEFASLGVAVIVGGSGLLYLLHLERQRSHQIREFFATFTHELKTSLASIRLQAEAIGEDLLDSKVSKLASRLLMDSTRLELQLENSLYLARDDESNLFLEKISLAKILTTLKYSTHLQIHLSKNALLNADSRALESITKNIAQNAAIHGQAQNLWFEVTEIDTHKILLKIYDDGKGSDESAKNLGQLFARQTSKSGSGIGLYIIRMLTEKMKGTVRFLGGKGFPIEITLSGELDRSGASNE